ncbi:DUF2807 domain-containing protein [uncultured Flavobacterium sp.]|uniref:GIN domain-containing protein n=1 Tax=uncultured Flavobacterium sp. TaxID=165435 RepID=UPI0030CA26B6|tara:strand:- start:327 stop:1163 length:837 start_codon:yes stop_codon:yes gene_type:complete
MKSKLTFLLLALLIATSSIAQKKEKIKGSKIVTLTVKEIASFDAIDFGDNLDVFLVKGEKNSIEIEADDNLHDAIVYEIIGNTLMISTTKNIISSKKFNIRINYSSELKMVVVKEKATLNALADLNLENIVIKNFDNSKSLLNVKSTNFTLQLNDKAEAELNIKADKCKIELLDNSSMKSLITTQELSLDMYQKSKASVEGDVNLAYIRLDNNASLDAKTLSVSEMNISTEMNSNCQINIKDKVVISATGKSEIELLGDPKIELDVFKNNATLKKIEK